MEQSMDSSESVLAIESKPRILVVDDDLMVRDVIVESIRLVGFEADVSDDGLEALELAGQKNYDLLVTDMRLPGIDGLSLIRRLRSIGKTSDVIVITGHGTIENAVECIKAGAIEYLIKPFTVEQIQLAVRKAMDLRELRRRATEGEFYRELSYVDSLTGVYNRRYLDESLQREIQKAERQGGDLVLLMVDIDDFKIYNDRNGHQMGDQALVQLGEILRSTCRAYDIVTRYGGEEFAVLVTGADRANASGVADRIVSKVRAAKFSGEESLPSGSLTVSVGMAAYPWDATTPEELLRCADQALYEAKGDGKDTIRVYAAV